MNFHIGYQSVKKLRCSITVIVLLTIVMYANGQVPFDTLSHLKINNPTLNYELSQKWASPLTRTLNPFESNSCQPGNFNSPVYLFQFSNSTNLFNCISSEEINKIEEPRNHTDLYIDSYTFLKNGQYKLNTNAQIGNIWCFGDSALVDYTDTSSITTNFSGIRSRGSCVSISDSSGSLLFYAFTNAGTAGKTTVVHNSGNQLMQSGDSIIGRGWYRELITVPLPGSDSLYYLFSTGVTFYDGIYFSVIDMSQNGGIGSVVQKNIPIQQGFQIVDCLTAVKHGNGRDYWIMFRRWNDSPSAPNTEFHSILLSPLGLSNYTIQNIGSIQSSGFGGFAWSPDGNKFAYFNPQGLLELYDYDRCSGLISNPITVRQENMQSPYETYWGAAFSNSGDVLYVSKLPLAATDTSRLYQFDLTASNILASADTLWETDFSMQMGHLKRAPDGRIYLATNYYGGFPYSDTTFNSVNMNLSVINSPDNLGLACDFIPFSFNLGGKRTYFGLPNNPDYFLGPFQGSICDTLTSINEQAEQTIISNLFPNPNNGLFSVNYFLINGRSGLIEIYNMQGKTVYEKSLQAYSYVHQVHLKGSPAGIYALKLTSGRHTVYKKFIIQ